MKALVVLAIVGLLGLGTATASAEEITPTRGTGLGQHVSSMAPEHAISMSPGAFGRCVSTMARTGVCPEC